ncbi:glycoside hydrolase family 5 protein [Roseibium sp.]|uniref:glycoside hydrolase family 5 protein n=1 Tax=Roseibium sp. TaxID=1936156 RepID=UPI003B502EFD
MIGRYWLNTFSVGLAIASILVLILTGAFAAAIAQERTCLRGVNIAGAEFGGYEGRYGESYIYPSNATLAWAASRQMTVIRLPFRWERLQPELHAALDPAELARLKQTVAKAKQHDLTIILDPHNFAEYRDVKIGQGAVTVEAFADFWRKLGSEFSGDPRVLYLLMNEPEGVIATTWFKAAQAAILAIRGVGADNLVLVPGTIWTGASHWFDDMPGGSNADVFKGIADPDNNFTFDIHQYLDADFSGRNATCPRTQDALKALEAVTRWMRQSGFQAHLGEFGGTGSPDCLDGLAKVAAYINGESDVWIGWTAWAAGDWWGDYALSLQPGGITDTPQMTVLKPYLTASDGSSAVCGGAPN